MGGQAAQFGGNGCLLPLRGTVPAAVRRRSSLTFALQHAIKTIDEAFCSVIGAARSSQEPAATGSASIG
jgi:hypothetical protein